jgi:hypothetical protein
VVKKETFSRAGLLLVDAEALQVLRDSGVFVETILFFQKKN